MRVFLIHGMGRSRASMMFLGSRLHRAGHMPSSFGYRVSFRHIEEIGERFLQHISTTMRPHGGQPFHAPEPYAIIGHSLGNVITRSVAPRLPAGFSRFIMLAPPNRPATLAKRLKQNPVFKMLTGASGQALGDEKFFESLPRPDVPTLILAGDGGPRFNWLPFAGASSDGIVSLDETKLDGVPHRVLPALHTFIMNHPQVSRTICHFLDTGRFDESVVGRSADEALDEIAHHR